jgi:hypothetical protein
VLGLTENDQAAARADERLDRVELLGYEPGRTVLGRVLPRRIRGMGDHEDIARAEDLGGERAVDVGLHVEVTLGKRSRGELVRRVRRVCRLHRQCRLGPDRPCLAVGLVEQDASLC